MSRGSLPARNLALATVAFALCFSAWGLIAPLAKRFEDDLDLSSTAALFLTAMVMMPVFDQAWAAGIAPYLNDQMDFRSAWTAASEPFRGFMLAQIRENDLMTFAGLSNSGPYATPQDVPFSVLAASFLTSELKTAFEIAFLIYIPFVIIDLVVASVLMSMGMMMLSPMLISAPFKILLFVLVDGWVLVVGSLAASFNPV